MSRDEFLSRLRRMLKKLPQQDADDALEYYEEYLEDAGPENEAATIAAWGSPDRIASQILAEYAVKQMNTEPSAKKGLSTAWVVVLAIFASPIAIPVAAAIACIMLALVIVVAAVILSVGAVSVSLAASGALCVILGACLVFRGFSTAVFYLGAGLFCAGAGIALFPFVIWLSKKGFNGIAKLFSKFLPRRKAA
jgi:uncharacterized membrane protein